MKKRELSHKLSYILVLFLLTKVVFAEVIVTIDNGTSINANEDTLHMFNIAIDNKNSNSVISNISITIPFSFYFLNNSQGTDLRSYNFNKEGNVLQYSFYLDALEKANFWFDATPLEPGNYIITVTTAGSAGIFSSNLYVYVNDTNLSSNIYFKKPSDENLDKKARNYIQYKITTTGYISSVTVYLFAKNHTLRTFSNNYSGNFTNLEDGFYYINASGISPDGNAHFTETRKIFLDTTPPRITLLQPVNSSNYTSAFQTVGFRYKVEDNSEIIECSLLLNKIINTTRTKPSLTAINSFNIAFGHGRYLWQIRCTDSLLNKGFSSYRSFLVFDPSEPVVRRNGTTPSDLQDSFQEDIPDYTIDLRKPGSGATCKPNWECGKWEECIPSYNIDDLKNIENNKIVLQGEQRRVCVDKGDCYFVKEEKRFCFEEIILSTQKVNKCFKDYLEFYDSNGVVLSRIELNQDVIDIEFSLSDTIYCSHCYDSVKNFDETEIDCGGENCPECKEKYIYKKTFKEIIKDIISTLYNLFPNNILLAITYQK
ncbi:hypothetical protein J4221_04725 [Candidatus Pacearchaeota archaeon]|nr:hypothetical protein [Candidatus Pacearchaeota archaeon]